MESDVLSPLFPRPDLLPDDLATRIRDALSRPPEESAARDARLLSLVSEAGVGAQALSVLVAIDVGRLCLADRVAYAQAVHAQASWMAALGHLAVASVAGTLDGWVAERVDALAAEWAGDLGVRWKDGSPRDVRGETWGPGDGASPEDAGDGAPRMVDVAGGEARRTVESGVPSVAPGAGGRAWQVCQEAEEEAWGSVEKGIRAEVASALRVSERTAGRRVDEARFLVGEVPEALAQAWRGDWQVGHLRVVEDHLLGLDARLQQQVMADVVPHAAIDTPGRLRDRLSKSLALRDAEAATERIRRKDTQRDTAVHPLPDGQAQLIVSGPAAMVGWMQKSLTALARARHATVKAAEADDPRSPVETRIGYLRTDALTESLRRMLIALHGEGSAPGDDREGNVATRESGTPVDDSELAGAGAKAGWSVDPWLGPPVAGPGSGRGPEACVIVDLATALGMAECPGWVPGQGWMPAPVAREILARASAWRRWLTVDGRVIDTGATYRPSDELRRRVHARDVTCTLDICQRPAQESQIDHAIHFDGTNTTLDNLHAACGPHHMLLTTGEFTVSVGEDGAISWTSARSGRSYASRPHPRHDVRPSTGHQAESAQSRAAQEPTALELMTLRVLAQAA